MNNEIKSELEKSLKKAKGDSFKDEIKRWIPSVIILPIALFWTLNRGNSGLIDNVDHVIHEAGHVFFSLFGKFIYTLGGSLMQVIIHLSLHGFSSGIITEPVFNSVCSG